jgi:hypothetical protein
VILSYGFLAVWFKDWALGFESLLQGCEALGRNMYVCLYIKAQEAAPQLFMNEK